MVAWSPPKVAAASSAAVQLPAVMTAPAAGAAVGAVLGTGEPLDGLGVEDDESVGLAVGELAGPHAVVRSRIAPATAMRGSLFNMHTDYWSSTRRVSR